MTIDCPRCGQPKPEMIDGWNCCHDCAELIDPAPQP